MGKRLIQLFMSDSPRPAIFEVEVDEHRIAYCSCPGYESRGKCKHATIVTKRIEEHDGAYPFTFLTKVSDEQIQEAIATYQGFREFIIKNAKVEVL